MSSKMPAGPNHIEHLLAQRLQQQAAVAELGLLALEGHDVQRLMDHATEAIAETLDVELTKVLELLPGGDQLLLRAGVGWHAGLVGQATVSAGLESQAGYTLCSQHPVIVSDLSQETRFRVPPLLSDHGVVSGLSVAIGGQDRPFGVLGAHTTRHRTFSQNDIHFLQSMAHVLATAIRHQQSAQALRDSEIRFRMLFDRAPVGVVVIDPETASIVECNELAARQLGYTIEEFTRLHISDFDVIETPEEIWEHIAEFLRNGQDEFETQHRTKTGEIRDVLVTTQLIELSGRKLAHAIYLDITERKRVEAALSESERTLSMLINNLPGIVYRCQNDRERTMTFVSDGCYEVTGYSRAELENNGSVSYAALVHPDDRDWLWQKCQASLEARVPCESQYRIRTKSGQTRWVWERAQGVYSPDGRLLRIEGFVQDITDRYVAAQKLQQTADRLSALLATAQTLGASLNLDHLLTDLLYRLRDVISIADLSSIYLYDERSKTLIPHACVTYQPEAFRKLRLKVGESVSGKVFQTGRSVLLRSPADVQAVRGTLSPENERWIAEARAGRQLLSTICVPLRTSAREVFGTISLGSTCGAFTEEDLSLLEAVAAQAAIAIQNATLYEELRVSRRQWQALSRQLIAGQEAERRHLARELHDEVGQVLTAVSLKLHNLKSCCDTEARLDVEDGIRLVDRAIEQVRGLSLNLRPPMLDVLGLEAAIRWCLDQHCEETGWDVQIVGQLETRLSADLEATCFRVIQGALTNVARHARAKRVTIELHHRDHELEVLVRDDGIGLNVEQIRQRSQQGESFGILSMQERVELAGGTFQIESTPGGGTTIRARFPLVATDFVYLD